MILDHPLSREQRAASQRNIKYFNAINGLSRPGPEMLSVYRSYFAWAFAILPPCMILLTRLEPLPLEKRRIKRSWWHG